MSIYQPARWFDDGKTTTIEASRFDRKTKYNEAQIIFIDQKNGKGKNYYHRLRLYSKPEMVRLMRAAGLSKIRIFGDFDGGKFDRLKSTHPIYIGER